MLAVHIADAALEPLATLVGWALAVALLAWSGYRLDADEVPRVAVLAAAFFVASSVRVPVGPTHAHLLLVGLVGVVLRRRAPLAISNGLLLQATLLGHGGLAGLGINVCVMAVPAVLAGWLFPLLTTPAGVRWGLAVGVVGWVVAADAAFWMLWSPERFVSVANLAGVVLGCTGGVVVVWRARWSAGFAAGLALGAVSVELAVALNAVALWFGALPGIDRAAGLVWLAHLPLAVVEGLIVGSTVAFLHRVRPDWLSPSESAG